MRVPIRLVGAPLPGARGRSRRRGRVIGLSAVLPVAFLALTAGPALATPPGTLDQHQEVWSGGYSAYDDGYSATAQTFTAGMSGTLTGVSLYCVNYGNTDNTDTQVQIQGVDSGGYPNGTVLATSDVTNDASSTCDGGGWVDFLFSSGPTVAAGTAYAIVWPGYAQWGDSSAGDPYPSGAECNDGEGWFCSVGEVNWDYAFRTYVQGGTTQAPLVSISKSNSASGPVVPGASVNYKIGLSWSGTTTLLGVAVTDQLPAGIGAASAISNGGAYNPTTNQITWTGLTLAPTATLTYTAVVGASTAPGTYTNTATITVGACVTGYTCTASSSVTVGASTASPSAPPSGSVGGAGGSEATLPPTSTLPTGEPRSDAGTGLALLVLVGALATAGLAGLISRREARR